jgi:hypothetical protein
MPILIYGHSDDCIELEGDFRDEFSAYDCWRYLHFADGTVVKCGYGLIEDKGWHFRVVHNGHRLEGYRLIADGEDENDRLELTGGDLTPVVLWSSADGPTADDMEEFWDGFETRDHDNEKLVKAFRVLKGME